MRTPTCWVPPAVLPQLPPGEAVRHWPFEVWGAVLTAAPFVSGVGLLLSTGRRDEQEFAAGYTSGAAGAAVP